MRRPSVLVVSYWFPPAGGSGVQRATKLARYLPAAGWDVAVLTVKDVSYYAYDPELLDQLAPDVEVLRSGSLDPARLHRALTARGAASERPVPVDPQSTSVDLYRRVVRALFVPDPQLLWVPFAIARALVARRGRPPDVVLSSSPPMSTHLAALVLARLWRVPLVTDFRDAWTQDPYLRIPSPAHRRVHRSLEQAVLRRTRALVSISERIRSGFLSANPWLDPADTEVIPNGYDPADFEGIEPRSQPGFVVKYVGSLHPHHHEPLAVFLRAFATARERDGGFAADARLRVIGGVHGSLRELAEGSEVADAIEFVGYQPHGDAVAETCGADALLLLVDPAPGNETTVTGKVFEYLGAERPIVLVGPPGDAADVLSESGAGRCFGPDEADELADHLIALRAEPPRFEPKGLQAFSRAEHARRFGELLSRVAARPPRTVLIAGPVPPPEGGIATFLDHLLKAVDPERHRVVLFDTSTHGDVTETGTWTAANMAQAVSLCLRAAVRVRRERPDVVQIEAGGYLGLLKSACLALAVRRAAPVVMSIHSPTIPADFRQAGPIGRALIVRALERASFIRVIHPGQADELRELAPGFESARIEAVPNFVEPWPAAQASGDGDAVRLVTVGSVGRRKGTLELVDAVAWLSEQGVPVSCSVLGPEEREGEFRAVLDRIAELGLESTVELAGAVSRDEVRTRLLGSDIFVLPTYREGLPMSILEAMGAGLPVVVTSVGAIGSVVDQPDVPPIPPGEPAELRATLLRLSRDAELRRRCGEHNRARVRDTFSPQALAPRFADLWDRAVGARARAGGG